jgi:hypothetical protein
LRVALPDGGQDASDFVHRQHCEVPLESPLSAVCPARRHNY